MESLAKAKESLQIQQTKCLNVIKAEIAANPTLAKAYRDLESINKAIEIAEKQLADDELQKAVKEASLKKANIEDAVTEVVALLDGGNIDDEAFTKIAKKFDLEEDELRDAVDEFLEEEEEE